MEEHEMEIDLTSEIILNEEFFRKLVIIQELFRQLSTGNSLRFSTIGPIKITIDTSEIVRKYAKKHGIIRRKKGIAFIIQDIDDFEVAIRKIQDLNNDLMLHEKAQP